MNSLSNRVSGSPIKQRGFVFRLIHSLAIVALVVGLVILYKTGKLSGLTQVPGKVSHWVGGQVNHTTPSANYRQDYAPPPYAQQDYDPRAYPPQTQTTYYDYQTPYRDDEARSWTTTRNYWDNDIYKRAPSYTSRKTTSVTKPKEDTRYTVSRYAVQVAAGYDSRQLYAWRDALINDGFHAYIISLNTSKGLLLKLRVGAYNKREQAEAMRDKLAQRYPEQGLFTDSFVIQGD